MNCVECKHRQPMGNGLMGCRVRRCIIVNPERNRPCCEKSFDFISLFNKITKGEGFK